MKSEIFSFPKALLTGVLLSGCVANFNDTNQEKNSVINQKNDADIKTVTPEDLACFNQDGCSYFDSYINGLGKECRIFLSQSDSTSEEIIYCINDKNFWEKIKIL